MASSAPPHAGSAPSAHSITISLSDTDRHALTQIRLRYGLATLSDAIRLAVHACAQSIAGQDEKSAILREVSQATQAEFAAFHHALLQLNTESQGLMNEIVHLCRLREGVAALTVTALSPQPRLVLSLQSVQLQESLRLTHARAMQACVEARQVREQRQRIRRRTTGLPPPVTSDYVR